MPCASASHSRVGPDDGGIGEVIRFVLNVAGHEFQAIRDVPFFLPARSTGRNKA